MFAGRFLLVLLSWLFVSLANFAARADDRPNGKLYFLGVAVDAMPPEGQTVDHYNYAPDNLSRILADPAQKIWSECRVSTLKGREVTRARVRRKFASLEKQLAASDFLFIYWGTHGQAGEVGWSASLAGDETISGDEIKAALGRLPCDVLIMVSTCGSGAFARPPGAETPLPLNVTAFCACRRSRTTSNELDVALCEALTGFADVDGNGVVTLSETLDYVPRRYRGWSNASDLASRDLLPVIGLSDGAPLARILSRANPNRLIAAQGHGWYGCSIIERTDAGPKVRYLGWDATNPRGAFYKPIEVVPVDRLVPSATPAIEVEWQGSWWPAKILRRTATGMRIHYAGYPASDDETVAETRIRWPYFGRVGD